MSLPLKTFSSDTDAKAEDVQNNFDEFLLLHICNELPTGPIDGMNVNFATASKFKSSTLKVHLSLPPAVGMTRLIRNTNYVEVIDTDGNGTGFQMLTPVPDSPQVLVVDFQKANFA